MDTINIDFPSFDYKGWKISHELRKTAVRNSEGVFELQSKPTFIKKGHSAEYILGEREYLRLLSFHLNGDSWEGV
jgi:hypothetical protein